MKTCINCVMDQSDRKIAFNNEGICDHCITFHKEIKPYWNPSTGSESDLFKLANKIKNSSQINSFNCLIGLSGGVDSSFLLHFIVTELGLKPLVFHVDCGWNSELAVNNIQRLIDKLGLDLYTVVINWEEMRDLQLSFFKSGVPHLDVPQDHAIFATMYHFAFRYNIKYIFTGGNYSTECVRNPIDWMYYQSDSRHLKDIHKKFGSMPLNSFPTTKILWHKFYLPYFKRIKVYRPLDKIRYNRNEAMLLLKSLYNWEPYSQKHFESRFTRFYESYWLYERFHFDVRKVQFSSMILTNQITREEALKQLESLPYNPETINDDFEFIANKLNISIEELRSYFNLPLKTYKDYKSQYFLYNFGSSILKKLKIEKGGKR